MKNKVSIAFFVFLGRNSAGGFVASQSKTSKNRFSVGSIRNKISDIRGGGVTEALPPLQDFSSEAANLFGNIRVPASLVMGAALTLGYAGAPKPSAQDHPRIKILKQMNALLGIVALGTELIVVLWSTIAFNKIHEVSHAPARSLLEMLKRDYELAWIGTNVHFILGLLIMPVMTALHAWVTWGVDIGRIAALSSASAILFMSSVVNDGVAKGDGTSVSYFGTSLCGLAFRYIRLLSLKVIHGNHFLLMCSFLTAFAAVALTVNHVSKKEFEQAALEDKQVRRRVSDM
mmetsp:Transcript_59422/g.102336  ORF Transcript_59422/g.102336 Transcript_59422/m.102336 type:complete len:288 (+) Transcript_59422:263-1126(+)